jgi:hypothetical protein
MARAYGSSAHLLMKRETAYGQAATGNYIRMPFNRCNLGSEQGLIDDPVLGQTRRTARTWQLNTGAGAMRTSCALQLAETPPCA